MAAIPPTVASLSRERLAGAAVTAWCEPADYGPVHHAVAAAGPGDVILIDAGGRPDAAMIGELLSGAARLKGIAGLAVDGKFGPLTEAAVRGFQQALHTDIPTMAVDGVVGPMTWQALVSGMLYL